MYPAPFAAETLHPGLWRASQVGRPREPVFQSGFAALDEALPGGGWPASALTELLLPHHGVGEMRLLAPVLARLQQDQHERCLMWFDPPALPCAWALQALGLSSEQLVVVRSRAGTAWSSASPGAPLGTSLGTSLGAGGRPAGSAGTSVDAPALFPRPSLRTASVRPSFTAGAAASSLWALEHALRSGHVGAVLAWLPARMPADALRRLQLAAQSHEGPAFLLRDEQAAQQASPAPLRLRLAAAAPDWLRVDVFKRRGPPLPQPLLIELRPVLAQPARLRAQSGASVMPDTVSPPEASHASGNPLGQPQGSWA